MLCLQCELQEQVWANKRDGQAGPKSLDLYHERRVHYAERWKASAYADAHAT